jgi:hypothetical protein
LAKRAAEPFGDLTCLPGSQGTSPQSTREALTIHQFGYVVDAFWRLPYVEDLHDARVVELGEQLCLTLERADPAWILRPPGLDQLDGDAASEPAIARSVDTTERTFANDRLQLISPVQQ